MMLTPIKTPQKILVTGANGFVGGWFAEAIHLSGWADVRAGVSRWSGAARIARFPLDICLCDVMNKESLDMALSGVDAVIHCARGREDDSPVSTDGTRLLLERARAAGVRKVIHMSSVAVYGDARGLVDEQTAAVGPLTAYGATKLRAEQICRETADEGMSIAVLRPTLIYGPFSEQWSLPYISRFASRRWRRLGALGEGKCNLVYVGDLVHFARHLLARDTGPFIVLNANGPEIPSWNSYLERFNAALGFPELESPQKQLIGLAPQVALRRPVRRFGKYMLAHHRRALVTISNKSHAAKVLLKRIEADLRLRPNDDEIARFSIDVTYSMEAAAKIGFVPQTGVDRGLALTADWAQKMSLVA
jgi:nucleoside-diphosphate-sugar epimerase